MQSLKAVIVSLLLMSVSVSGQENNFLSQDASEIFNIIPKSATVAFVGCVDFYQVGAKPSFKWKLNQYMMQYPNNNQILLNSGMSKNIDAVLEKQFNAEQITYIGVDDVQRRLDDANDRYAITSVIRSGATIKKNKGRQLFGGGNIGYKVRTIVFDPDRCSDELNTLKQILGCDYIIICSMAQGMSRISDLVLGETRGVIQFIEPRIDDIESWNYYYAHLPANVTARTFESKETTYARLVDLNRAIIPKIIASDISDMLKGQNVGVVTKPFPVARVDLGDDDIIFVYYSPSGVKSNLDRSPTAMTVIAEGLSPDEIIGEYDVGRQVVPGIRGHLYNLGDGEHAISQISGYRVIPSIDEKNNYYYVPNISFDKY